MSIHVIYCHIVKSCTYKLLQLFTRLAYQILRSGWTRWNFSPTKATGLNPGRDFYPDKSFCWRNPTLGWLKQLGHLVNHTHQFIIFTIWISPAILCFLMMPWSQATWQVKLQIWDSCLVPHTAYTSTQELSFLGTEKHQHWVWFYVSEALIKDSGNLSNPACSNHIVKNKRRYQG